jgi:UDP-N-acetylmuramoylalanine--D-glutamate ligase
MSQLIASSKLKVVVGIGVTGLSVARHLTRLGERFVMCDTRQQPPGLEQLKADMPDVPVMLGELSSDALLTADEVILSPGLTRQHPAVQQALAADIPVINDIELFARSANASIIAITGSNGKSTVTTLVGEMCADAKVVAGVGGNLGVAALDLLQSDAQLYVLELSSFQLETTYSLSAEVATILNVSQDHLDRYASFADYLAAKQRVYDGCQVAVWNRDDLATRPPATVARQISFGAHPEADYRLDSENGQLLCRGEPLLSLSELALTGHHNAMNILSVLAISDALSLNRDKALATVKAFTGLPHRCQLVAEAGGVRWFNDSKATNVGATLAALTGIGESIEGKVILVAGGQGKGQDFSPLAEPARQYLRAALLMGEDRNTVAQGMSAAPCELVADMAAAVARAHALAQPGDAVLLSPACASFDMFSGFAARGDDFTARAREVCHD